jgi:hypothetical protein
LAAVHLAFKHPITQVSINLVIDEPPHFNELREYWLKEGNVDNETEKRKRKSISE